MAKKKFLKGSALFAQARKKAAALGVATDGLKLVDLIHRIQQKEGNPACFRVNKECAEVHCCWQSSCGALMRGK